MVEVARVPAHMAVAVPDGIDDRTAVLLEPLATAIHPRHAVTGGEVVWAARHEMARTVEDFLARRSRLLLLDARASMEAAPAVARLLARELGRDPLDVTG